MADPPPAIEIGPSALKRGYDESDIRSAFNEWFKERYNVTEDIWRR